MASLQKPLKRLLQTSHQAFIVAILAISIMLVKKCHWQMPLAKEFGKRVWPARVPCTWGALLSVSNCLILRGAIEDAGANDEFLKEALDTL